MLEAAARPLPAELNRGHGGLAPDLAFAWLITGDGSQLEAARSYLLKLADTPEWDPQNDLIHGHLLQGMALAYDWLYPELTEAEREKIAGRLGLACEGEYERMTTGRVWYHNQYFQNHGLSNFCGLFYAACALYGEHPDAGKWLANSEDFYRTVIESLPADGTSLEGISYGAYDYEYLWRYVELSRTLLGQDYSAAPGLKNFPAWVLHSLLPAQTATEWAMTFGDAPRHVNWHGPEPQIFLAASRFGDGLAQWLGRHLIELEDKGLASADYWSILWYDPAVAETPPDGAGTFRHFTENDQVMMRSAWNDPNATLVGLKCGPFMGRSHSLTAEWDWGTNHQEPDAASFQFFSHGRQLAIDPLYNTFKRTANHNTLLFKGNDQMGADIAWMGVAECLHYRQYPTVIHAEEGEGFDYVVGDATRAYHPDLGLRRFQRHYLFLKPDILVVADEIVLDSTGTLFSIPSGNLKIEGELEYGYGRYVVGKGGEAYTIFEGKPGTYRIAVNYLDNYPGQATMELVVDGKVVNSWQNTNRETDNNYQVTPNVQLKTGSRVAVRLANLPPNWRLIRLAISSRTVVQEPSAEWLLHFPVEAEISESFGLVSARVGDAALDVRIMGDMIITDEMKFEGKEASGLKTNLNWGVWDVLQPHDEVKQTQRLVYQPRFRNGRSFVVAVLRARDAGAKFDLSVGMSGEAPADGSKLTAKLNLECADYAATVDWDLRAMTVGLTRK
ncbi:MAG: DUF4962 domain-containing protein, partial [Candidatus Glassbacteria bacterium]